MEADRGYGRGGGRAAVVRESDGLGVEGPRGAEKEGLGPGHRTMDELTDCLYSLDCSEWEPVFTLGLVVMATVNWLDRRSHMTLPPSLNARSSERYRIIKRVVMWY